MLRSFLRKQIDKYKLRIFLLKSIWKPHRQSHTSGNSPAALSVMTKEYKSRDMNS